MMPNNSFQRTVRFLPSAEFAGASMNYRKWVAQKRQEFFERVRTNRDRANAKKISVELEIQNQLREFYFSLPEDDLKVLWNGGDNELLDTEREIVRIALRNKLGIK